ncbi:MAG: hypothetical protein HC854_02575 [Flavobacterium sp.]|nr:hypothetical protein [Flavobacterium sp.]
MASQLIGTRQEKDAYKGLDLLNNLVLSEPNYTLAWEKMAETYRVWNMFDKHNADLKRCYQKIKELQALLKKK